MDSKKRPHDDDDTTATKKRILTGPYGSPLVNGNVTEQDEPDDVNNLEVSHILLLRVNVLLIF